MRAIAESTYYAVFARKKLYKTEFLIHVYTYMYMWCIIKHWQSNKISQIIAYIVHSKWNIRKFKAALAVNFVFFPPLQKTYAHEKSTTKNGVFVCLFRLERNKECSTFTINIESSFNELKTIFACNQIHIHYPFSPHFQGKLVKVSDVCFKIIYSMTNQSL